MKPKIVIWCGPAANHRALACRIHENFPVSAIIIDEKKVTSAKPGQGIIQRILNRVLFRKLIGAWTGLQNHYTNKYPGWPNVPVMRVPSINSPEAETFTRQHTPDLIIVSGTSLVKKPMLAVPVTKGIINLHTGLSPYIKGGPNCTNWCIAENKWNLVGNTIMWINSGIDSGNIITSETIDIRNASSLTEAHIRVMDHAHDLYIRSIKYLFANEGPYNSVVQKSISEGHLYLTKMWDRRKMRAALKNWKNRKAAKVTGESPVTIRLS